MEEMEDLTQGESDNFQNCHPKGQSGACTI